jgi:hypothetical protein
MALSLERQLPEEILDHIVSLTAEQIGEPPLVPTGTLATLCLTSKTLNRLATVHLYSTLILAYPYLGDPKTHIIDLAYLFVVSPAHAALVTSVVAYDGWGRTEEDEEEELDEPRWPNTDKPRWPNTDTPELEGILKTACANLATNDEEADKLYHQIQSGTNENAIMAFMLLHLPNLQKLDINLGMFKEHADFAALLKSQAAQARSDSARKAPALTSPIHVMVKGEDDKYPNPPGNLTTFFHLPNVRTIYGWKFGDHDGEPDLENGPFAELAPRSCPVEYVELRCSKLHKDNFRLMMNALIPEKLKTFSYEVGCTWAWCNVEHAAMMQSLSQYHETLESLALSHEDFYPYQFGNDSEKPYPCSFVHFKILKRLKVAPVYIWGHDNMTDDTRLKKQATKEMLWKALPAGLEELWITRAQDQESGRNNEHTKATFIHECLLPALESVIQNKAEALPKLASLRIEFPAREWEHDWLNELAAFCGRAVAAEIQCTIILEAQCETNKAERKWGWNEDVEWGECTHNREGSKKWIDAAKVDNLAKMLGDLKREGTERWEAMKRNEAARLEEMRILHAGQ